MNNTYIVNSQANYARKESSIILTIMGDSLSNNIKEELTEKMKHYGLKSTRLIVKHMSTENGDVAVFQKVLERNENMLSDKENKLMKYELELVSMRKNVYPVGQLMKELALQFTGVDTFSIVIVVYANAKDFSVQDTIPDRNSVV